MITKSELKKKLDEICESSPNNTYQPFITYLVKNKYYNVKEECIKTAQKYGLSAAGGIYVYVNDLKELPKCIDCKIEIPRFINLKIGFLPRCKKCGTLHSHEVLKEHGKNKTDYTKQRLKEAAKKLSEKKKLQKQNYNYLEITQNDLDQSYQEVSECNDKGYLVFPMDNLKLNKIRNEYPHLIEVLKSMIHNKQVKTNTEGLYWLLHRFTEHPHCKLHLDDKCTDNPSFINFKFGYNKACGHCSKHKPEARLKLKETSYKKYGVSNPMKAQVNIDKRSQNNQEKYGVSHPMKLQEFADKRDETIKKIYGVDNIMKLDEFKEKRMKTFQTHIEDPEFKKQFLSRIIITNRENYGTDWYFQSQQFKEMIHGYYVNDPKWIERRKQAVEDLKLFNIQLLETPDLLSDKVKFKCTVCGYEGEVSITRIECGYYHCCQNCYPISGTRSKGEINIINCLKENLGSDINIDSNNRKILADGKEIDIYLPDYNIAIEYNGTLFHSTYLNKEISNYHSGIISKDYHYIKWLKCKNKNIDLITVFDDDWYLMKYRKIAIPLILSKFGKYKYEINSNQCSILSCKDQKIIYQFLKNNCVDRFNNYDQSLCFMYNNQIICMLTYKDHEDYYDIRYCNVKDYNITNGFNTLFNKFITDHNNKPIRYSVNRDWFDCPKLEDFGFKVYDDNPNLNQFYWGVTLYRRKMLQDFNEKNYEMLKDDKLSYLYDCGNVIYEYKK